MDQEKKKSADPQITLVLRAAVGAYLLYLAWGLREAAFSGESTVSLLFMIVFALAGTALLVFSVRRLWQNFSYPEQSPDDPDGEEDSEETDDP